MRPGALTVVFACLVLAGVAAGESDMGHDEPMSVAASCGAASATVSWAAVTDPHLAGYNVYRKASWESAYTLANSGLATATQYLVTGLSPATSYSFGVVAVYIDGHTSAMSTPASCTTG